MIETMDTLISKTLTCFDHLNFGNSRLFWTFEFNILIIVSYFEIRYSNFIIDSPHHFKLIPKIFRYRLTKYLVPQRFARC